MNPQDVIQWAAAAIACGMAALFVIGIPIAVYLFIKHWPPTIPDPPTPPHTGLYDGD